MRWLLALLATMTGRDMANTLRDVKALTAFVPCDKCGPNTRSAEIWSARDGEFIMSLCQSHADKFAVPLWDQGFRPIMKAPVTA